MRFHVALGLECGGECLNVIEGDRGVHWALCICVSIGVCVVTIVGRSGSCRGSPIRVRCRHRHKPFLPCSWVCIIVNCWIGFRHCEYAKKAKYGCLFGVVFYYFCFILCGLNPSREGTSFFWNRRVVVVLFGPFTGFYVARWSHLSNNLGLSLVGFTVGRFRGGAYFWLVVDGCFVYCMFSKPWGAEIEPWLMVSYFVREVREILGRWSFVHSSGVGKPTMHLVPHSRCSSSEL